jgi:hypothetical protein
VPGIEAGTCATAEIAQQKHEAIEVTQSTTVKTPFKQSISNSWQFASLFTPLLRITPAA